MKEQIVPLLALNRPHFVVPRQGKAELSVRKEKDQTHTQL